MAMTAYTRYFVFLSILMVWLSPRLVAAPLELAGGQRQTMNSYTVLHLRGTPQQLGRQHGLLMKREIQRMIQDLLLDGVCAQPTVYARLIKGAMVMEQYLEPEHRQELRALAEAAEVDYRDLVLAQLFGDVQRAQSFGTPSMCTSLSVFGPATKTGECLIGRNMDFWDYGVSKWGAVLLHYRPERGLPFMTVSWAGIINGWTAMNVEGVACANNTAFGSRSDSLEGLSTCFMVRKVVQYAHHVEEGIQIVQDTPRACGTNLLIAGGNPPQAAVVEFDHAELAVRWAEKGAIWTANSFEKLYRDPATLTYPSYRFMRLQDLIQANYGHIDRRMNFLADYSIALRYINLHSAWFFPKNLQCNVAMSRIPAVDHRYKPFQLSREGLRPIRINEEFQTVDGEL